MAGLADAVVANGDGAEALGVELEVAITAGVPPALAAADELVQPPGISRCGRTLKLIETQDSPANIWFVLRMPPQMLEAQNDEPDCDCNQCLSEQLDAAYWKNTELEARIDALGVILNAVIASLPNPEDMLRQLEIRKELRRQTANQSETEDSAGEIQQAALESALRHYTQVAQIAIELRRAPASEVH